MGDPGVQLERTALARQRTMLSSAIVSLALGLLAVREDLWVLVVPAAALATAAVVVPAVSRASAAHDELLDRWPSLLWATSLVAALAVLAAITAWAAARR